LLAPEFFIIKEDWKVLSNIIERETDRDLCHETFCFDFSGWFEKMWRQLDHLLSFEGPDFHQPTVVPDACHKEVAALRVSRPPAHGGTEAVRIGGCAAERDHRRCRPLFAEEHILGLTEEHGVKGMQSTGVAGP